MQLCKLFSLNGGGYLSERKPFRWFHGGVNAAGYGVGFVAGENTGADEAGEVLYSL